MFVHSANFYIINYLSLEIQFLRSSENYTVSEHEIVKYV